MILNIYIYVSIRSSAQDLYQDDKRIWNALFEIAIKDLSLCEQHGVDVGGTDGKIYPIVLANKGDWSYLVPWMVTFFLEIHLYASPLNDLAKRYFGIIIEICFVCKKQV